MNDLEMPGLTDTLQRKLDWLRETRGIKRANVSLDEYELQFILSSMLYCKADMAMRRAEKLPLAVAPLGEPFQSILYDNLPALYVDDSPTPDTLHSETE